LPLYREDAAMATMTGDGRANDRRDGSGLPADIGYGLSNKR
jgi:hypothetical protein